MRDNVREDVLRKEMIMAKRAKKQKTMTCVEAPDITITQKVLNKDALPWKEVGFTQRLREVRVIDGKHVALIGITNNATREAGGHEDPYLKCACDLYKVRESNCVRSLVSTHQCERKLAWGKLRRKEVGEKYQESGTTLRDAMLDLCDRVWNKGEYVGQTEGSWLYVQHVAEMFDVEMSDVLEVVASLRRKKRVDLSGMVLVPYQKKEPDPPNEKRTPMVSWESMDPSSVPELVWVTKLDGRFQIEVQRMKDEYKGVLCIFDHHESDRLLHAENVGLSYGARFGPDADDVLHWESLVTQYVDKNFPPKTI